MSRPQTLHKSRIEIAIALLAVGLTRRAVARHIGVPESTLRSALARDPELAERAAQARNLVEVTALQSILRAMNKSWRAAACFLQYTNPDDYGRKRKSDPESPAEYDDLAHITPANGERRAPSGCDGDDDEDWDDDEDFDKDKVRPNVVSAEEARRQLNQLDQDRPIDPLEIDLTIQEETPPPSPPAESATCPAPSAKSVKSVDRRTRSVDPHSDFTNPFAQFLEAWPPDTAVSPAKAPDPVPFDDWPPPGVIVTLPGTD
jgi:hypothetical protein